MCEPHPNNPKAIDEQRRFEAERLTKEGDDSLEGTRYLWLKGVAGLSMRLHKQLAVLLETAHLRGRRLGYQGGRRQALALQIEAWATKAWIALCKAARKLEIPALDTVIDTVRRHLFGIVNAITLEASNRASESVDSRVQAQKKRANGYHSRARFRAAILSHLGGLDPHPRLALGAS